MSSSRDIAFIGNFFEKSVRYVQYSSTSYTTLNRFFGEIHYQVN